MYIYVIRLNLRDGSGRNDLLYSDSKTVKAFLVEGLNYMGL